MQDEDEAEPNAAENRREAITCIADQMRNARGDVNIWLRS